MRIPTSVASSPTTGRQLSFSWSITWAAVLSGVSTRAVTTLRLMIDPARVSVVTLSRSGDPSGATPRSAWRKSLFAIRPTSLFPPLTTGR